MRGTEISVPNISHLPSQRAEFWERTSHRSLKPNPFPPPPALCVQLSGLQTTRWLWPLQCGFCLSRLLDREICEWQLGFHKSSRSKGQAGALWRILLKPGLVADPLMQLECRREHTTSLLAEGVLTIYQSSTELEKHHSERLWSPKAE